MVFAWHGLSFWSEFFFVFVLWVSGQGFSGLTLKILSLLLYGLYGNAKDLWCLVATLKLYDAYPLFRAWQKHVLNNLWAPLTKTKV